jgi:NADPH:quinone reductase
MSPTRSVHAVVMREYGPPAVLIYDEVLLAPLGPDEVRIKSTVSAVNHTDLEIRAGNWPVRKPQPFPYVPGVEVVGVVEELGAEVGDLRIGDRVITMMQGLGGVHARRPGAYAEFVTVTASAVALIPPGVDSHEMAVLGLPAVTALEGLRRIGELGGRHIVVTGAAGGVGSAATAIARAQGAFVIGIVARPEQVDYVRSLGANEVIVSNGAEGKYLPPRSVDGILDSVAGELFPTLVESLKAAGTLSLVGAVAGLDVGFNAFELIRPVKLTGYSSETLNGLGLRNAVKILGEWLINGSLKPGARTLMPMSDAAEAHALLERRGVSGRLLLVP